MSSSFIISLTIARLAALFGGTALPGLIGLTLDHTLINQIIKKNKLDSVIITGTNGKTTTARLLGAVLHLAKIDYCHNYSGSNLLRGIATTLINQSNLTGKLRHQFAVWEVDEATLPAAIKALKPKLVVITNLSRDQLDRYGEVDTLLSLWQKALDRLPQSSTVLVNAADHRLKTLRHKNLSYFGSAQPGLGLKYPQELKAKFNLDSLWAVEAVCRKLKLDSRLVRQAALSTPPAFGRGEVFELNQAVYQINLVKNPASLKAVWQMIYDRKHLNQPLLLILNDQIADGTDVSWIWDAPLPGLAKRRTPVVASGRRANDLALRLKYAGLKPELIMVEPKIKQAFKKLQSLPGTIKYILPTYTAMLELRRHLNKDPWN
ncbi:MAG: MurT ligase domain-containing protein [Patescibacteria group bacterium]|nr:MurT ligase domain-containing protein [Patescibacteria group bacterium]